MANNFKKWNQSKILVIYLIISTWWSFPILSSKISRSSLVLILFSIVLLHETPAFTPETRCSFIFLSLLISIGKTFKFSLVNPFFHSEFSDFQEFSVNYKIKLERILQMPTRFWKNKLKLSKDLKKSWIRLLKEISTQSNGLINSESELDTHFIVDCIFEIIRSLSYNFDKLIY